MQYRADLGQIQGRHTNWYKITYKFNWGFKNWRIWKSIGYMKMKRD